MNVFLWGLIACKNTTSTSEHSPDAENGSVETVYDYSETSTAEIVYPDENSAITCLNADFKAGEADDSFLLVDQDSDYGHFSNIQDALDYTQHDANISTVFVCPGTYEERVSINTQVNLIGVSGAQETIIDRSSLDSEGSALYVKESSHVEGFTLTGAYALNTCFYGGGIYAGGLGEEGQRYTITIQNNIITGNDACAVGGIYASGFSNSSDSLIEIRNNLISDNISHKNAAGITVSCDRTGEVVVKNNDIVGNVALGDTGTGGFEHTGSASTASCSSSVVNNNFYGNTSSVAEAMIDNIATGNLNTSYNNFFANNGASSDDTNFYNGTESLFVDPQYKDENLLTLSEDSPCHNSGNPNEEFINTDGTRNTIGAYGGPNGDW